MHAIMQKFFIIYSKITIMKIDSRNFMINLNQHGDENINTKFDPNLWFYYGKFNFKGSREHLINDDIFRSILHFLIMLLKA